MTIIENDREFLFRIPDRLEDLEDQENSQNFYSVNGSTIRNSDELASKIKHAEADFMSEGTDFILEHFDTFYYVVKNFRQIKSELRKQTWHMLFRNLSLVRKEITRFINDEYQMDKRRYHQNKLLMTTYPLILMSESYETEIMNNTGVPNTEIDGGGNNNRKKQISPELKFYEDKRSTIADEFNQLFSLRLKSLFEPAYFLNSFTTMITRWLYRILENNTTAKFRSSSFFTKICEIITQVVLRYQHAFCMKIIELLQAKEMIASNLSDIVAYIINNFPRTFLMNDIINQIKSIDIHILSRDSSGPRAISSFLVELGYKCTNDMFKNISDMFDFLEQDSYLLRNATLEVISVIILKLFESPKTLKDEHVKDKLLDKLEEHIADITSYTRSRTLNLWSTLAQNQAIPIDRLPIIIELACGRLEDKSCFVRKSALNFLTLVLKNNQFCMMSKKEMVTNLEKVEKFKLDLRQKLIEIIEKQDKQVDDFMENYMGSSGENTADLNKTVEEDDEERPEDEEEEEENANSSSGSIKRKISCDDSFERRKKRKSIVMIEAIAKEWTDVEQLFLNFWKNNSEQLKDKLYHNLKFPKAIAEDDSLENGLELFRKHVIDQEFESALISLFSLKNLYPDNELFRLKKDENTDVETSETEEPMEISQEDSETQLDAVFMSSLINFSSKWNTKLPYEISLARNVFLAQIIKLGNKEIEEKIPNETPDSLNKIMSQEMIERDQETIDHEMEMLHKLEQLAKRLKLAIMVTNRISKSVPAIANLLNSKNVTDILESINFFTHAHKMEIENSVIGVQKMLKLINLKEKTVLDALLSAFIDIYLNYGENKIDDQETGAGKDLKKKFHYMEVKNLSSMILKLNQGELKCAEAILKQLFLDGKFNDTHMEILWERYAMRYSSVSEDDSRAALMIIRMFAAAQPAIIRNEQNLANVISTSLEKRRKDYRLVAETCDLLSISVTMPQTETLEKFFKLPEDHVLFKRLHTIMEESIIDGAQNKYWLQMSSGIIKVIYFLAEKPDPIISKMVKECYEKIVDSGIIPNLEREEQTPATESQQAGSNIVKLAKIEDIVLSRFIFMLGDIAVNLLIHLDVHIKKELKIRQYIKEKEKEAKKVVKERQLGKAPKRPKSLSSTLSTTTNDDDEVLGPNSSEDPQLENISKACDAVLFDGLLHRFESMVERIAMDFEGKQYSPCLRLAASLTLAKFLLLSVRYTRAHRDTLANILDKCKDPEIRSNVLISFGDLLVQYPNEFEHFTAKIFRCLSDENFQVKTNALKVLTRLILADMIKPKGNISKIAQLIVDENQIISSMARLFFVELAKKNNVTIYNYLPDIISNLSGEKGIEEAKFKEIIRFLFELLEKSRNTESLVTKLCHRFANNSDERMWRDLSFCLAQLTYNDRALYNLANNFSLFSNCLCHDPVFENISSIIDNYRRAGPLKREIKDLFDELENQMKKVREKGTNQNQNEEDSPVDTGNPTDNENDNVADSPEPDTTVKKATRRKNYCSIEKTQPKKRQRKNTTVKKEPIVKEETTVRRSGRVRKRIILDDDDDTN